MQRLIVRTRGRKDTAPVDEAASRGAGSQEWTPVYQNGHGAPRVSQSSASASSKATLDASSNAVFPLRFAFIIRVSPAVAIEATVEGRRLRSARLLYS